MMNAPQPYEEIDHTADLGIIVRGASAEECIERVVCVFGQLVAGREDIAGDITERVVVARTELALVPVDILRELLFRFATQRVLPAACRVARFADEIELEIGFARWDAAKHSAGEDIKAVTYHEASFAESRGEWVARVIFDI